MVERILVVGPKDTISMVDDLAPKGFEIVKALHNSPEQKAALPGTHYFVGFVQQYVNPQLFKDAPKLKLIQLLSAGYDRADIPAAIKARVPMCNNGGANSVAVSEHAMLLMLSSTCVLHWRHCFHPVHMLKLFNLQVISFQRLQNSKNSLNHSPRWTVQRS